MIFLCLEIDKTYLRIEKTINETMIQVSKLARQLPPVLDTVIRYSYIKDHPREWRQLVRILADYFMSEDWVVLEENGVLFRDGDNSEEFRGMELKNSKNSTIKDELERVEQIWEDNCEFLTRKVSIYTD